MYLGQDHPQGQGLLKKYTCGVKLFRLIPVDLAIYPYIIWVSYGEHSHPPPAIARTPASISAALFQLVQRLNDPMLTRSK
jgi:hypothetical protein